MVKHKDNTISTAPVAATWQQRQEERGQHWGRAADTYIPDRIEPTGPDPQLVKDVPEEAAPTLLLPLCVAQPTAAAGIRSRSAGANAGGYDDRLRASSADRCHPRVVTPRNSARVGGSAVEQPICPGQQSPEPKNRRQ